MKTDCLFLISSIRNILSYFLGYLILRFALFPNVHWEYFMKYYSMIFVIFFVAGIIASNAIRKRTGDINHLHYFKYEIAVVVVFISLFEIFSRYLL
jgi:pilus assembly protein TadC